MVRTFWRNARRIGAAILSIAVLMLLGAAVRAASASPASDTLTRLKVGVAANHEIIFKTPTGIDASTDTIILSLPDFTFGSVGIGDIDLFHGTTTASEVTDTIAAASAAGVWGVSISGTTITFTAPTDAGVGTVPANNLIRILIGTNAAGGANQLTNPATSTSALISISGAFGDSGSIAVAIVDDDTVAVTATVAATTTPPAPPSGGGAGSSPPVIWNVLASKITDTSVRITWNTDKDSNSSVSYGFTTAYASGTVTNATLVTSHVIDLTGLLPNTTYHFQATSVDSLGLSRSSGDFTFTTLGDITPPVITGVRVTNITDSSALVLWETNEPSTSLVTYWKATSTILYTSVPGYVTNHSVQLTGLGSTYYFFVSSVDPSGNVSTSTIQRFDTIVDVTPPANVIGFTASPGDGLITLTWTNPSDTDFAGVRIVRKTSGYPTGPFDGTFIYNGSGTATIETGLLNGLTYYYAAYAYDTHGNFASGALASGAPTGAVVPPPSEALSPPPSEAAPEPIPTPAPAPSPIPTPTPSPIPGVPPSPIVSPPITGVETVPGALTAYFLGNNGTVQLEPDASGIVGVLAGTTIIVRVPVTGLGSIPVAAYARVGTSLYSLQPTADGTSYTGSFVIPLAGDVAAVVAVVLQNGTSIPRSFTFSSQPAGRIVEATALGPSDIGLSKTTIQLYREVNGTWQPYATLQTDADGRYSAIVPNGRYYAVLEKDGYRKTTTAPFTVTRNVINQRFSLIRLPEYLQLVPGAPVLQNIGIIFGNIGQGLSYASELARAFIQSPQVQAANAVATPALLVLSVLNAASSLSIFNLLAYLQYVFTQPILLFGKQRRKKWGIVYNSLTKQPVDLAIVRLVHFETKLIVQTKVTDKFGRYAFIAKIGNYQIEVVKPGYLFPTQYLSGKAEDVGLVELYHGDRVEAVASIVITPNIPLDPVTEAETPRAVLWRKALRKLQHAAAFSGIPLGMIVLLITPSLPAALLLLAQIGIYLLFRRLAVPTKAKSWGIAVDSRTRKPIAGVILRIFDKRFNKLLETQVTDKNGKYGFLVRRNIYYVIAEKPGFKKFVSPDIDLSTQDEAIVDQNIALQSIG